MEQVRGALSEQSDGQGPYCASVAGRQAPYAAKAQRWAEAREQDFRFLAQTVRRLSAWEQQWALWEQVVWCAAQSAYWALAGR
ncbi:hypothetical protein MB02_00325 [Croceicoccus estronivorus]|nr:hypothetical protein MB02_00325 [Croceicoccus estronivorus]